MRQVNSGKRSANFASTSSLRRQNNLMLSCFEQPNTDVVQEACTRKLPNYLVMRYFCQRKMFINCPKRARQETNAIWYTTCNVDYVNRPSFT